MKAGIAELQELKIDISTTTSWDESKLHEGWVENLARDSIGSRELAETLERPADHRATCAVSGTSWVCRPRWIIDSFIKNHLGTTETDRVSIISLHSDTCVAPACYCTIERCTWFPFLPLMKRVRILCHKKVSCMEFRGYEQYLPWTISGPQRQRRMLVALMVRETARILCGCLNFVLSMCAVSMFSRWATCIYLSLKTEILAYSQLYVCGNTMAAQNGIVAFLGLVLVKNNGAIILQQHDLKFRSALLLVHTNQINQNR